MAGASGARAGGAGTGVAGTGAGLRFAEDGGALAPHVIVGHADIASAGARAVLLLREVLRRWAGAERTVSGAGEVWAVHDDSSGTGDGLAAKCARAWESADAAQQAAPAAPLQVDTFHSADGRAVVSVVCINAQVPASSTNAVALDLARKLVADQVRPPACASAAPRRRRAAPRRAALHAVGATADAATNAPPGRRVSCRRYRA